MLRFGKITVTPGFWAALIVALLSGAAEVLPLMMLAALLHELGHLAAMHLVGTDVEGINFTLFGAEIRADTRYLPYWKDIFCTLAGPAVNIAAALLLARASEDYLLAGANLLQGTFNLLPLTGLDGARLVHLILSWVMGPVFADRISVWIEFSCAAVLTMVTLYLVVYHRTGGFLFLAMTGVFVGIWREIRGKQLANLSAIV